MSVWLSVQIRLSQMSGREFRVLRDMVFVTDPATGEQSVLQAGTVVPEILLPEIVRNHREYARITGVGRGRRAVNPFRIESARVVLFEWRGIVRSGHFGRDLGLVQTSWRDR